MSSSQIPPEKLEELIQMASNKTKLDPADLKKATQSGKLEGMLDKLPPDQAKKLQDVLSDKAATERLLSTPQARMLLKKILEGKNGQ